MNSINKTLYIPLWGKAYVSELGIILDDPRAGDIWAEEEFTLRGKSASKWLAYYMGMRAAVFDRWVKEQMDAAPDAVVLHIGCGLDSRCERVGTQSHRWFDVDFPQVIGERRRYYRETENYRMVSADMTDPHWLEDLPGGDAVVIMEGVSMYLPPAELKLALDRIAEHFDSVHLLMDCYTTFAARASRYKNPINDVGVTKVYGMDDPNTLPGFLREHDMTPPDLIDQLRGMERWIFRKLYAGSMSKKMYRLYEYRR